MFHSNVHLFLCALTSMFTNFRALISSTLTRPIPFICHNDGHQLVSWFRLQKINLQLRLVRDIVRSKIVNKTKTENEWIFVYMEAR